MTTDGYYAIIASIISSIGGLAGGFLLLFSREKQIHRISKVLIGFAAGVLLSVAFLDLLPEAIKHFDDPAEAFRYVLLGVILFFLIERVLSAFHRHQDEFESSHPEDGSLHRAVPLVIFGDTVHNFLDGIVVAAAFLIDRNIGIATAVSVLLHELPHEIADFTILLHAGISRRRVLIINVLSALVAPIGTVVGLILASVSKAVEVPLLAFAAGNLLYLALSDLLPHLHHERRLRPALLQIILFLIGILVFFVVPGHG